MLIVVTTFVEEKQESKVHKSLAEILGIPKRGDPVEQAKVAVVIDPKIAKVLRPHQIEGVKVPTLSLSSENSFSIVLRQGRFTTELLDASWRMKWVSAKRYFNSRPRLMTVTMYHSSLDITSSISTSSKKNDSEMYNCMSLVTRA
jgi:hypothetical protein